MLTIKDLKCIIATAEAEGELHDESEIRIVTREDRHETDLKSVELSLDDAAHVIIPAGMTRGVPADRRFGSGALLLVHEQQLRDTPHSVLEQLGWTVTKPDEQSNQTTIEPGHASQALVTEDDASETRYF
jgi:hypothetical protein